jgi:hypothetical protein
MMAERSWVSSCRLSSGEGGSQGRGGGFPFTLPFRMGERFRGVRYLDGIPKTAPIRPGRGRYDRTGGFLLTGRSVSTGGNSRTGQEDNGLSG